MQYDTDTKTARMQAVADKIDSGAGAGTLEIGTTAMGSVLATFTLADPCGSVSGDTLTFDFDPDIEDSSADNAGTAAAARIKDSNGTVRISGLTVGTSGTNVVLDNTNIAAGQRVILATASIQHAA